jgi:hypothetical protein
MGREFIKHGLELNGGTSYKEFAIVLAACISGWPNDKQTSYKSGQILREIAENDLSSTIL